MKVPALPAIRNHFTYDVKFKIHKGESIGMVKRGKILNIQNWENIGNFTVKFIGKPRDIKLHDVTISHK
jgi:hypothetical protein